MVLEEENGAREDGSAFKVLGTEVWGPELESLESIQMSGGHEWRPACLSSTWKGGTQDRDLWNKLASQSNHFCEP